MRQALRNAFRRGPAQRGAVVFAIILVLLGLLLAAFSEDGYQRQKASEIAVQSQIVSASVSPALMFDNSANAQDYLSALSANPAISAAAVYNAAGVRIAAFTRAGGTPAPSRASVRPAQFEGQSLVVVTPVRRDGETLGAVYLRTDAEPALRRFSRYAGVGILILLAALVVTMFGVAQGILTEANAELEARAQQLLQEIEQRERAEEELLQSRKLEAIGQLTGGVAHDFNNLLTVVLSGLRLMERNSDPARRASTMEAMRQAVERGAGLTRQLLAFSRRQALKLEPVDIGFHLQGMRALLERSLRADILVDIAIPADLWPVKTDPTQFELAILNLAVNARDAMPKGGVLSITAANAPSANGDYVEVRVRDTGTGIPADVVGRVFEPYFTTKQAGQGTGLGLSQVYGITKQSGGDVRIESVPNEGTCVTLVLPRSDEAPALAAEQQTNPSTPSVTPGKAILVVEDDDAVAGVVDQMLREMGCRPTRVENAQAALTVLERDNCFDLVFSDIIMPGAMNGVDLANEIHRRYPRTPIVLTTGFSGSANVDADFPVLRKPYQIEELERALMSALEASGASR
jgi:signal transduction histidine kinase